MADTTQEQTMAVTGPTPQLSSQPQPAAVNTRRVEAELAAVEAEITAAEAQDAKYSGGLVKSLIAARLQTLRHTHAMLQQRAKANDLNISLHYTVDGRGFSPPADAENQIAAIEAELTALRAKIAMEQADAARYRGGLVRGMKLSSIATMQQTEAMLDQKRLSLQHELPQFLGFHAAGPSPATGVPATAPSNTAPPPANAPFEIVSVHAKVTESNSTWWKYAWKVVVRNRDSQRHQYRVTVEFQDKDGFIVDTDKADGVVEPNSEGTITDFDLVTATVAPKIARTIAKVLQVR